MSVRPFPPSPAEPNQINLKSIHAPLLQGSGVRVYTATSPLGPYTFQGSDIACQAQATGLAASVDPTPGQGCLFYDDAQASVTRAQQNFVIEVRRVTACCLLLAAFVPPAFWLSVRD
jgi:hypothetical protein